MDFKVGVGKSDFASLRSEGNYYIDKTEIIYELVNDTNNEVTLFTRPRRFGKTLMMSMFENFFNIEKNSRDIFEGLNITNHESFCEEYMNKYPVLFISFKDVEGMDFNGAFDMLKVLESICYENKFYFFRYTFNCKDKLKFLNIQITGQNLTFQTP